MPERAEARRSLRVEEAGDGARLDAWLAEKVEVLTRNGAQSLIRSGAVKVGAQSQLKPSTRLRKGETVSLRMAADEPEPGLRANPDLPLHILHADASVLVVDKAAGRVVHPAAGHHDDTLVNALVAEYPDLLEVFPKSERPGIVHRLDRDTSGVMVVARTAAAAKALKAQFKDRRIEKVYGALLRGRLTPDEGVVEAPIGRDPMQRKRMAALAGGKPARTVYRLLGEAHGYSWVEARPLSGRTHQIRVHFAALGHPVAGDLVYGKRDRRIPRLALHAWQLGFEHPADGAWRRFESPLPSDIREALESLAIDPSAPPEPWDI